MIKITGPTIIFTDHHFGLKGNSPSRQKIGVSVIKSIISYAKSHNVKNIIFAGDYFHQRNALSVDTINIAFKCMQSMAKTCTVYMILGNHDLFMKNSVDVNSINMFQDIPNVNIISHATEVDLNSKRALFIPWLADLSKFSKASYDFMFGHFDISSKYLISSYVDEHSRKEIASEKNSAVLSSDILLKTTGKANDLVGDFVELCKESGTIFAGHIHTHKEFKAKKRNFIFVGSPYQQTLGDIDNDCGFYFMDDACSYKFIKIDDVPKHIIVKMSDVIKTGIDAYDFSTVKGNIVQKTYDVELSPADETRIAQKINDMKPYEELLPDYQVKIDYSAGTMSDDQAATYVDAIKKSKLDYVKSYIDNIDDSSLVSDNIDKTKLFDILKTYYTKIVGA